MDIKYYATLDMNYFVIHDRIIFTLADVCKKSYLLQTRNHETWLCQNAKTSFQIVLNWVSTALFLYNANSTNQTAPQIAILLALSATLSKTDDFTLVTKGTLQKLIQISLYSGSRLIVTSQIWLFLITFLDMQTCNRRFKRTLLCEQTLYRD